MNLLLEIVVSLLLLAGGAFMLLGSWGLVRLPDFYTRLHAPTKATTLGMAGLLLASMLYFSVSEVRLSVHELLITLFLFLTAPVSAHMLAKTALHHRVRVAEKTQGKSLMGNAHARRPPSSL